MSAASRHLTVGSLGASATLAVGLQVVGADPVTAVLPAGLLVLGLGAGAWAAWLGWRAREREVRLATVVRHTAAAILVTAADDRHTPILVNPAFRALTGFSVEDLSRIGTSALFGPGTSPEGLAALRAALKNDEAIGLELLLYRDDGLPFWGFVQVAPARDEDRAQRSHVWLIGDISERKRADATLRAQNQWLNSLIDSSPDAICLKDENGRWLMASQRFLWLFGLSGVAYHGKTEDALSGFLSADADRLAQWRDLDEQAWHARQTTTVEVTIDQPETEPLVLDVVRVPLMNPDGSRRGLVVVGRDVTRRKQAELQLGQARASLEARLEQRTAALVRETAERRAAEAALQEKQHFEQALLDAIPDPIFFKGTDRRYLGANRAFATLSGHPVEDIVGRTTSFVAPYLKPQSDMSDSVVLTSGLPYTYDTTVQAADGTERLIVLVKTPFLKLDGSIGGIVGIIHDITERRRMEQMLRTTEERAVRFQEQLAQALETIFDGFVLWDAEDRMVMCNKRFLAINPILVAAFPFLPTEDTVSQPAPPVPPPTFEEALRVYVAGGGVSLPPDEVEEWIAERLRQHRNPGPPIEQQASDGGWMLISERRTQDGGIVGIYTDITVQKEREAALAANEAALRALSSIISDHGTPFEDKLTGLLELGCERFGLPVGLLTRTRDGCCNIVAGFPREGGLALGNSVRLSDSFCVVALRTHEPTCVSPVAGSELSTVASYETTSAETYLGVPVFVEGEPYGVLTFIDTRERSVPFSDSERDILRLMAQWIGREIERQAALRGIAATAWEPEGAAVH